MPTLSDWTSTTTGGAWENYLLWSLGTPRYAGDFAFFTLNPSAEFTVTLVGTSTISLAGLDANLGSSAGLTIAGATGDSVIGIATLAFDNGGASATALLNVQGDFGTVNFSEANLFRVRLDSNLLVSVGATNTVGFAAPISGVGAFTKVGAGIVNLWNPNTFSGGIFLKEGRLYAYNDAALGTGSLTISGNALFTASPTTIDNAIMTVTDALGAAGSAQIAALSGATLEFTGTLWHRSQGTITFGTAANAGTILANFSTVQDNVTNSSYRIAAGTLAFGDAYNAANLLRHPGTGLTTIDNGATLDTRGFQAQISNLDLNGGTIRASSGALLVNIIDVSVAAATQNGTFTGTAGLDRISVTASHDFSLASAVLASWSATDEILLFGNENSNQLTGTAYADGIYGNDGNDILIGNGGIDEISGGGSDDVIQIGGFNSGSSVFGDSGVDTLRVVSDGSASTLTLAGFSGFEAIELAGGSLRMGIAQFLGGLPATGQVSGSGSITIDMALGYQTFLPRLLNVLPGSNIQMIINGTSGTDIIKANLGATNHILAGDGLDVVQGGSLADRLLGGGGVDKLSGNGGADRLNGGAGADVFKFRSPGDSGIGAANRDFVEDFEVGIDKLNFRRIDTDLTLADDQGFNFIGTAAFSASGAAEIRYGAGSGFGIVVSADVNGDGVADMEVFLNILSTSTLTAADFIL